MLSNYPDGIGIRASIERVGIAHHFSNVVVSGDVGWVKPHPQVFEETIAVTGARPEEIAFVGDNWLADIQGARRAGMVAVHTRQWEPPDEHPREDGHEDAHLTIDHLTELAGPFGLD